ncbi:phosphatase 2C-like domain-containing protein [Phycomyces nitens]|nr:phosphatase 2C-like domain-containing protein [Phycomyces nitens]
MFTFQQIHNVSLRSSSFARPLIRHIHLSLCRRSEAVLSRQEKIPSNLSMIDFFDPALSTTPRPFTLHHGVSGYAKRGKSINSTITTEQDESAYSSLQFGDDAYFKRHDALGVADGVGGWRNRKGANPALYSRKIMHYCQLEIGRARNIQPFGTDEQISPVDVMSKAYQLTTQDTITEGIVGSTTACIVLLCQNELRVANIGDCGVSVIRRDNFIFRSEEQQHSFNFPYQLGTSSCDTPADAQQFSVKVEEGDIIILGSDGLFDNLYDEEILEEILKTLHADPQAISDALAMRAKQVSEDLDNPTSPFQVRAMHEGLYYQGGKADDITVLVAVVNLSSQSMDNTLED